MNINESLKLWKRGIELMPRGTQTMSKAPDQYVFGVHPIYIKSGKGCKVNDIDNNTYIDYGMALGPIILGYSHKPTMKAINKQLKKGITFSLMSPLEVELAALLNDVILCAEQVRYAKNGTDATLAAVRVARSYSKKEVILKPEGHYHGWSDWHAASTTRDHGVPSALKELVRTFKYNDPNSLEGELKKNDVAAVIMEPVALEPPRDDFLGKVRDICDKYDVILIFDEMITGFRWALGGAQEYYGITPDLATFGKAVANGMPLSIIAGKKKYMQEFDHIFFSMTFGGEALSLAAAISTIKIMKKNPQIFEHMWYHGNKLRSAFNDIAQKLNLQAEMIGCAPRHNIVFSGEDPQGAKDLFHQEMVKSGILIGTQIYTTWAHKEKHIFKTIKAIDKSLMVVAKAVDENNIDKYLEGKRSVGIFKKQITEKKF